MTLTALTSDKFTAGRFQYVDGFCEGYLTIDGDWALAGPASNPSLSVDELCSRMNADYEEFLKEYGDGLTKEPYRLEIFSFYLDPEAGASVFTAKITANSASHVFNAWRYEENSWDFDIKLRDGLNDLSLTHVRFAELELELETALKKFIQKQTGG